MKCKIYASMLLCGLISANGYAQDDATKVNAVDMGLSVYWGDRYLSGDLDNASGMTYFYWGSPIANEDIADGRDMGASICGTNYDPATALLGIGWRMPTADECRELAALPTKAVSAPEKGQAVTAENGNELFFKSYSGFDCAAWSGTANNDNFMFPPLGADMLKITADGATVDREGRSPVRGYPVRPVKVKEIGSTKVESVTLSESEVSLKESKSAIVWATTLPESASNRWLDWTSDNSEIATVDQAGRITAVAEGTTLIHAVTTDGSNLQQTVTVTVTGGSKKNVDLGLSVEWGAFNIGANSETEAGSYFCWGQTEAKTVFTGYPYFNRLPSTNIAGTEYDAATAEWGEGWRTPTREEWQELVDNCTIESPYALDGVQGALFTSKVNGNTLFLPPTGYKVYSNTSSAPMPIYMTAEAPSTLPFQLNFYAFQLNYANASFREYEGSKGYTVRGVHVKPSSSTIDKELIREDTKYDVYSLTGQPLIIKGTIEDVDALAPGIYIVRNGNKSYKINVSRR